jgi:hypothetical protein
MVGQCSDKSKIKIKLLSRCKSGIKILGFLQKCSKIFFFLKKGLFSCIRPSLLKDKKKSYRIFIPKKQKIENMHFDFNNQIIKAMRTKSIFQKKLKKYFVFF